MDNVKTVLAYKSLACEHEAPCIREISRGFGRNFLYGCAIKLVIRLITERNITKILQTGGSIPNFGLVAGLFSALFKITKCLLKYFNISLKRGQEMFLAGVISSLALLRANHNEKAILKLLIFPRAIECGFQLLCQKGYIQKFKHGDIVAYCVQIWVITYCYLLEETQLAAGFAKTIDSYSKLDYGEKLTVLADKIRTKRQIYDRYGPE